MTRRLVVEADGGSRGNPGPAAYGALVRDAATGEVLAEAAAEIGVASNNVAEYRGLIAGLRAARAIDPGAAVDVRLDSKLIVEQMSGRWKIKHADMRSLATEARGLMPVESVTYTWVPREQNRDADRLVNAALDGALGDGIFTRRKGAPVPPSTAAPSNTLVGWAPSSAIATSTLLLRHGESIHTSQKRFSGSGGDDPGLSDRGRWQAEQAGSWLAAAGEVDVVVASPLRRTRETAMVVAAASGADLVVDDGLRECAFGEWDGSTFAEVRERWPAELANWLASTAVRPPGGESFDEVRSRVCDLRDRLVEEHKGKTLLLVTHVTPLKTMVQLALDAPSHSLFRMEVRPASLSCVVWFDDGNASLRSFNDTAHLREDASAPR
ncbi:MAG: bifunctional RNase H/acid phosphatase [Actinomycetota bacterium]|nr:bifunctional RNase H/acid phosphatase [Actinomycetota bacterium]